MENYKMQVMVSENPYEFKEVETTIPKELIETLKNSINDPSPFMVTPMKMSQDLSSLSFGVIIEKETGGLWLKYEVTVVDKHPEASMEGWGLIRDKI